MQEILCGWMLKKYVAKRLTDSVDEFEETLLNWTEGRIGESYSRYLTYFQKLNGEDISIISVYLT